MTTRKTSVRIKVKTLATGLFFSFDPISAIQGKLPMVVLMEAIMAGTIPTNSQPMCNDIFSTSIATAIQNSAYKNANEQLSSNLAWYNVAGAIGDD